MSGKDSATTREAVALPALHRGLLWGFLGVAAFSLTVPLTRVAVDNNSMSPMFVGAGRAVIAASLAAIALTMTRQPLPCGRQWVKIGIVAAGVVVGFPMLTSYALTTTPASHGAVVIALLPATTAIAAVLRTGERPPNRFWFTAVAGMIAALVFAVLNSVGLQQLHRADLLLFAAVAAAAIGYAEGGLLAKVLGAWQTVSWALVLASPVMIALTASAIYMHPPSGGVSQWLAFGYLSLVSMFLGFFAWYRGLAIGPMTQVSQIQLIQPVMSLIWAALLLHEHLTWATLLGGAAVIGCAATAVRARTSKSTTHQSQNALKV